MGKRERRGDPRWPSSNHGNVDVDRFHQLPVIRLLNCGAKAKKSRGPS